MAKALAPAFCLLLCVLPAYGQAVRDEAAALVLRAQQITLFSGLDVPFPYHERVKFTLSGAAGETQGQFMKDYLSREQWRERYELGNYLRITVRNGRQLGEFRSAVFEPLWIDQLQHSLPPLSPVFEQSENASRITTRTIRGVANKCIEYQNKQGGSRQKNELCVKLTDGTVTSWHQRIVEGACVLGCETETEWSGYVSFGDKLYPRHLRITKRRSINADLEFTAGNDLNKATFQIPNNLEIRRACDKTTPPVRVQGELPTYPHRMNELLFEGTVAVQARIGIDGHVQDAQVATPHRIAQGIPGLHPGMEGRDVENAVLEAVRKWVFEPAKCDGVPMVENTLITFKAEVR